MMQTMIDASQAFVNGTVRMKLYKGAVTVAGRKSDDSLFDARIATFDDDGGAYNQKDAEGFIKLNALRMRIAAVKVANPSGSTHRKTGAPVHGTGADARNVEPSALPATKRHYLGVAGNRTA
jgi:hypothetical protein